MSYYALPWPQEDKSALFAELFGEQLDERKGQLGA